MANDGNSVESIYSKAKLLVCSPSYSIGNLAGVVVSLVKGRRLGANNPVGMPWAYAGGVNYLAAKLGFLTKATSAAFIDKVVVPWLAASLLVDGFSREPFGMMRRGYRDARLG